MLKMRNIAYAACVAGFALSAHSAQAAMVLQWSKVPTAATDEKTCLAFAKKVGQEKFKQMKEGPNEIAGITDKARASIICVSLGKGQKALGIVMATGADSASAKALRDDIATALKGVTKVE